MRSVLQKVSPDIVIVHGDTTTSVAAALSAFYMKIPVAHNEAGLRTNDIYNPWPEEMNRLVTGRIAQWHFAPTYWARQNLLKENINEDRIAVTGNTVIDALQWVIRKINSEKGAKRKLDVSLQKKGYNLHRLKDHRKLVLVTGHRRESFGEGFINICQAIKNLAIKHPELDFVYPVHLNPNVRKPVREILHGNSGIENVFLLDPLDYRPFVYLMNKSWLILTDSGGIQEEAPGLGKPVLVMRNTTERPEGLDAGTVKLVGSNSESIESAVSGLLRNQDLYKKMLNAVNPYGDGKASERIVSFIRNLP